MKPDEVAQLKSTGSEVTLETRVNQLAAMISSKHFVSFYCASNNEIYRATIDYVREQLNIAPESVIEIALEPHSNSLKQWLMSHIDEINSKEGDVVLITAEGFEKNGPLIISKKYYRLAHDYEQNAVECANIWERLKKKIIVATHIGPSLGEEAYEAAVKSAHQSDFRYFVLEFPEYLA